MKEKYKKLSKKQRQNVINKAKMMFFAHRDYLWNRFNFKKDAYNPNEISLYAGEEYYGEFFGIFRSLVILGYGYFGADVGDENEFNMKHWAYQIHKECLEEEDWKNSDKEKCYNLLSKYRELTTIHE